MIDGTRRKTDYRPKLCRVHDKRGAGFVPGSVRPCQLPDQRRRLSAAIMVQELIAQAHSTGRSTKVTRGHVVDLWDLTRLLARRWYFALPMLLVSLASVVVISQTVPPGYSATGHRLMIPPSNRTAADVVGRVQNPWEEL